MRRVLVVDDEHLVADTLSLIFKKCGFNARATYSVDEALVCAREFNPELLLCDISMPERDGLELMKELSRELPDCRFLVLTGYYDDLQRVHDECSRYPRPAAILTKPCQPGELLRQAGMMFEYA